MIRILGLCGSLRAASKNRWALELVRDAAPDGVEVRLWNEQGGLPHFSPDLDGPGLPLPPAVAVFHAEVAGADALLIACPEYAHGIPGAFKNALDWLVGSTEFPGKPVALLNVAPHASQAQTQLRDILRTMSADLVDAACRTVGLPDAGDPISVVAFQSQLRVALELLSSHQHPGIGLCEAVPGVVQAVE